MDADHEGDGGASLRIWSQGTLMHIVPLILSFFRIYSTRLLALQCSKILLKLAMITASQISAKITQYIVHCCKVQQIATSGGKSTSFWRGQGQKYCPEFTKIPFSCIFLSPDLFPAGRVFSYFPPPLTPTTQSGSAHIFIVVP